VDALFKPGGLPGRRLSRTYRGRFAPSPTGPLHAGSLLAALGSWLLARQAGGEWLVRNEDVDRVREVPGGAKLQWETLKCLALHAEGPWVGKSGRGAIYRAALDRLLASGRAFVCHCSRSDLAATGGIHRACATGRHRPDPAVRLRVEDGTRIDFVDGLRGPQTQRVDTEVGDFVLLRADGCWAYQLAVVVDDAAQAITDVVRGADLLDSTPRQILLQRELGLPTPRYLHLPLLVDAHGRKLSKSEGDAALAIEQPVALLARAWAQLGQSAISANTPDPWLRLAVERFQLARMPQAETLCSQS